MLVAKVDAEIVRARATKFDVDRVHHLSANIRGRSNAVHATRPIAVLLTLRLDAGDPDAWRGRARSSSYPTTTGSSRARLQSEAAKEVHADLAKKSGPTASVRRYARAQTLVRPVTNCAMISTIATTSRTWMNADTV